MTILISLDSLDHNVAAAGPSTPRKHAWREAALAETELRRVVRVVKAAKRIVVVCGAGVSTAASIPDFRSADGLFSGRVNKGKGRAKGEGVRDLFHVKSLGSPELLEDHQTLINELCDLAFRASPTAFHNFLYRLDLDGRLLRCYTQNIDGLESRAGLSTGIPLAKSSPSKRRVESRLTPPSSQESNSSRTDTPLSTPSTPPSLNLDPAPRPLYRCIPLHGDLTTLHCQICSSTYPIDLYLPLGPDPIECPACSANWHKRHAARARSRPVGALRANVVLYGEDHPLGEAIGAAVERDLRGTGPRAEREGKVDFLIVAGTSLSIPGVKRMVKELARSSKASRKGSAEGSIRTVLVNNEFPRGSEWSEVFDVWVQGDVQAFVEYVEDPLWAAPPTPPKTPSMRPADKQRTSPKTPSKSSGKKSSLSTGKAKHSWTATRHHASPLKITFSPTRIRPAPTPSPSKPTREGTRKSPRTPAPRSFMSYSVPHPTPTASRTYEVSDTDSSASISDFESFLRSRFEGSLTPLSDYGTPEPQGTYEEGDFCVDTEMRGTT